MMSDVDNGGGYVTMGGIRKISVSSSQFCCKPQTALKNKMFIKVDEYYLSVTKSNQSQKESP